MGRHISQIHRRASQMENAHAVCWIGDRRVLSRCRDQGWAAERSLAALGRARRTPRLPRGEARRARRQRVGRGVRHARARPAHAERDAAGGAAPGGGGQAPGDERARARDHRPVTPRRGRHPTDEPRSSAASRIALASLLDLSSRFIHLAPLCRPNRSRPPSPAGCCAKRSPRARSCTAGTLVRRWRRMVSPLPTSMRFCAAESWSRESWSAGRGDNASARGPRTRSWRFVPTCAC
jgi:hypothetical protein